MLFDYVAMGLQPGRAGTVWSRFPLQPLAPGALTPFSTSVLSELAGRAWYTYYDRLGFEPTPRSKVVRQHKGHLYFNLTLGAQLEADQAGIEPLALTLNGQRQALAAWEKPGFLAGLKFGRAQKKMDDLLAESARQMATTTEKARAWYLKTQAIKRWGQAEVLQIMEEIERIGVESMVAYLAARLNLAHHTARLLADLTGKTTPTQAVLLMNRALCNTGGLVETGMLDALAPLVEAARSPGQLDLLKRVDAAAWHRFESDGDLPSPQLQESVKSFLAAYGHRAAFEGEMARPRLAEDASLLLYTLLAQAESPVSPAKYSPNEPMQALLTLLPSSARKQGEQSLHKLGELYKLQSSALHALMYVWAGTRTWALAAAREAMVDKRLHGTHEAFLFELEEVKQLMTGEWNISSLDEIRAKVEARQIEFAGVRDGLAPDALLGDDELFANHNGVPGVAGQVTGPLSLWLNAPNPTSQDAIVAAKVLDSGCVLALPLAAGFVAAAGSPCDPFVLAAQAWQHPVAVGLGQRFEAFGALHGTPTTLAVGNDGVTVNASPR